MFPSVRSDNYKSEMISHGLEHLSRVRTSGFFGRFHFEEIDIDKLCGLILRINRWPNRLTRNRLANNPLSRGYSHLCYFGQWSWRQPTTSTYSYPPLHSILWNQITWKNFSMKSLCWTTLHFSLLQRILVLYYGKNCASIDHAPAIMSR